MPPELSYSYNIKSFNVSENIFLALLRLYIFTYFQTKSFGPTLFHLKFFVNAEKENFVNVVAYDEKLSIFYLHFSRCTTHATLYYLHFILFVFPNF